MKFPAAVLLATLVTGIVSSPTSDPAGSFPQLVERKACWHESTCTWFGAAKCEHYCRQFGQSVGVSRMEKCNWLNQKRCCCSKK